MLPARKDAKAPSTVRSAVLSSLVTSVVSLAARCHSGGKTWEFVAMAGNRWNPISRDGYATFSVFPGDLRSSPNRI